MNFSKFILKWNVYILFKEADKYKQQFSVNFGNHAKILSMIPRLSDVHSLGQLLIEDN